MLIQKPIYLDGWKRVNSPKPIFFSSWSQTLRFHIPDVFLLRLLQKLMGKPTSFQRNQRPRVETPAAREGSGLRRRGFCSPPSMRYSARSHPSTLGQSGPLCSGRGLGVGSCKTDLKHGFRIRSGKGGGGCSLKNKVTWLKLLQLWSKEKMYLVFPNYWGGEGIGKI